MVCRVHTTKTDSLGHVITGRKQSTTAVNLVPLSCRLFADHGVQPPWLGPAMHHMVPSARVATCLPPTTSSAPLQSTHCSILFFFFSTPVSTGLEGDLTVMVVICFFLSLLLPSISPLAHEEHHTYPCVSTQPGPPDQIEGLTSQLTRAPQPNLGTPRHVALLPHHGATHVCSIAIGTPVLSRVQQSRAGVGGLPPDAVPYSVGLWQCAYQLGAANASWPGTYWHVWPLVVM